MSVQTDNKVVKYENETVIPTGDGTASVQITHGSHQVTLPVRVENQAKFEIGSAFASIFCDLDESWCNTGKCHGAASGKDGFRLSLFGYDPEGDYIRLTREIPGRRINLAEPGKLSADSEGSGNGAPHRAD